MTRFHRVVAVVLLALLLGGCQLPSVPWIGSKPKPTTEATTPAPAPPETPALTVPLTSLFPPADWHAAYSMQDQGKAAMPTEEDWLRDGQRIVATQGGVPYVTWLLRDDGLWRLDPKGSGVLLRYLPAMLQDGLSWKQQSSSRDIWFALTEMPTACGPWQSALGVDQCWQLQVINRGDVTTFLFGSGAGVLKADDVNYTRPADSFVKILKELKQGTPLTASTREAVLDKGAAVSGQSVDVITVPMADFRQALATASHSDSP